MLGNKLKIIVFVIIIITISGLLFFTLFNYIKPHQQKPEEIKGAQGVPLKSSTLYSAQGWDKIQDLDKLQEMVGKDFGGEITSIKYLGPDNQNNYWANVSIENDYESFKEYYRYTAELKSWELIKENQIPRDIKDKF